MSDPTPVRLDPFSKLVGVNWASDYTAILQVDRDAGDFFQVNLLDPSDGVFDFDYDGTKPLDPTYYADKDAVFVPGVPVVDTLIVDQEIEDCWFFRADVWGDPPPNPNFDAAVAYETARFGRGPDIFSSESNGITLNRIVVTREDGSTVVIYRGYTIAPGGDFQEAVWYDVGTIPAVKSNIVRNTWMINFEKDRAKTLSISATSGSVAYTNTMKLSLYPKETTFTFDTNVGSFIADKTLSKTFTATAQSSQSGTLVRFDKTGFLKGTV